MMERWLQLLLIFVIFKGNESAVWKSLPTGPPFDCPESDGFFTMDGQCSNGYYFCHDGTAYYEVCPEPDVFDPQIQKCVPSASCSITTTVPTTTVNPYKCPINDGFFPIPETCAADFYVCTGGSLSISSCPDGTVFDPVTYICTLTEKATCNMTFDCSGKPAGFYPYPGACSGLYFYCSPEGTSVTDYCPANYVFDPLVSTCVQEEKASCTPGPVTTTTPTTTTPTTTTPTTTTPTTTTPTTTTPTTTTPTTTTPTSTTPTTTTPTTTTPTTTTPTTTTPTTTTPATTTQTTTTTPVVTTQLTQTVPPGTFVCPTPNGNFEIPGNCTSFWNCTNGVPRVQNCPPGLAFDPVGGSCEYSWAVPGCEGTTLNEGRHENLIGIDSHFRCPGNGVWPHPDQCDLFYTCYRKQAHLWKCKENFLYDIRSHECKDATTTHCG